MLKSLEATVVNGVETEECTGAESLVVDTDRRRCNRKCQQAPHLEVMTSHLDVSEPVDSRPPEKFACRLGIPFQAAFGWYNTTNDHAYWTTDRHHKRMSYIVSRTSHQCWPVERTARNRVRAKADCELDHNDHDTLRLQRYSRGVKSNGSYDSKETQRLRVARRLKDNCSLIA